MNPTPQATRDFDFFRTTRLDMVGHAIGAVFPEATDGYSALECFFAFDTHGETLPCREPELLAKAQRGKASWNLQVRMWAEGLADGTLMQDELRNYCHGLPEWIFDATVAQAAKLYRAREGWTPTFLTVTRVYGQWWPAYMLKWSPEI